MTLTILFLIAYGLIKFSEYNSTSTNDDNLHDLLILISDKPTIYTMDERMPNASAVCIDTTTGKFLSVSKSKRKLWEQCIKYPHKSIQAMDVSRYFILPGLIDSHAHIMMQGALQFDIETVDLSFAYSFRHLVQILEYHINKYNIKKGEWIKGIGYDESKWYDFHPKKQQQASRWDLDKWDTIKDYKLSLYRIDLHAVLVNTAALDELKPTFPRDIDNIQGGMAVRDAETGELTGLFIDNAKKLITKHIHPYYGRATDKNKYQKYKELAKKVIKECNQNGLTSIHDMDEQKDIIDNVYKAIIDENEKDFSLRLNVYVHGSKDDDNSVITQPEEYSKYFMYGDRLSVSGVKLFLDGALGMLYV